MSLTADLGHGAKIPFETVGGEAATTLLDAMSRPAAKIVISGSRSTPGTPTQSFSPVLHIRTCRVPVGT